MNVMTNFIWDPIMILWFVRLFIKENETVNWLFVLFSNVSMMGPYLLYWVSILLIFVGYAIDLFALLDPIGIVKFVIWIMLSFAASYF